MMRNAKYNFVINSQTVLWNSGVQSVLDEFLSALWFLAAWWCNHFEVPGVARTTAAASKLPLAVLLLVRDFGEGLYKR